MIKYFLIGLLLVSNLAFAQEEVAIALERAPIDMTDSGSIKRGAKFFATNCMVCHTLIYMRYDPIAKAAGITYDKMPVNVTNWPYGVKPPDLSLEANIRGVDWIYTYLHSFYLDPSRPTGVNNLVFPNTAMAGIVMTFQGQQVRLPAEQVSQGIYGHKPQWYDLLVLKTQGVMTPEEFDNTITDVVNFLAYAADPYKVKQHRIGWWVIGFLIIFTILLYFLKAAYWHDLKKKEHE